MSDLPIRTEVVVVGAGNAALCSAIAAAEAGVSVVVLERASEKKRGGNGVFTGGFLRFAFNGVEDLRALVDLTASEVDRLEVGQYTAEDFFMDVAEVTEYRTDPDLVDVLVNNSFDSVKWLRGLGVPFLPSFGLHPAGPDGKVRMSGVAPAVEVSGGGAGLIQALYERATKLGIPIIYGARAVGLLADSARRVVGVKVRHDGAEHTIETTSVVLACGGFEANAEMRARYLGPSWDLVRVRGTGCNTGDGIKMAQAVGAQAAGHWSGCHAAPLDLNAPLVGDRNLTDAFIRRSFHLGITVNRDGVRFFDEGADLESKTYSKMGQQIVQQPGQMAYQIFDASSAALLRSEYALRQATQFVAPSITELAVKAGIDPDRLDRTVREFNAATTGAAIDPLVRDGISALAVSPAKSNWAAPLSTAPFVAFPVTCGITFTYGGVKINSDAQVMDEDGQVIAGLFAAGELVGGLFYGNYPTGCGIMAGTVFGRTAGNAAAKRARAANPD
jgi:tricarballylate dehydrogenase